MAYLKRWELRTPYPKIVRDVAELVVKPPLRDPILAVDATGLGRPVVDLLRESDVQARLRPVVITAGHAAGRDDDGTHRLPKRSLVWALQIALQSHALGIANVPCRELLAKELQNFRVKITAAANETFEAWREGTNDDLVLAVALACWAADREDDASGAMPFALESHTGGGLSRTWESRFYH